MRKFKLSPFVVISIAFHVAVISAIVLFFFKDPPSGGKQGTVMVGIISGQDNGQSSTSANQSNAEAKTSPEEVSKPKVALKKKPTKNTVKQSTKNKSNKNNVKTTKKEINKKPAQVSASKTSQNNNAAKGIESASIVNDGNFGSPDSRTKDVDGAGTELAYPNYSLNPKPHYPRTARKRGYEGEVRLRVFVLENGKVGEVVITRPSGHKILDRSALDAVKTWKFIPGKENGKEISSWITVPITFQLKSG